MVQARRDISLQEVKYRQELAQLPRMEEEENNYEIKPVEHFNVDSFKIDDDEGEEEEKVNHLHEHREVDIEEVEKLPEQ